MRQLGIRYNFAPVIDVDYNPDNPNIGKIKRAYSADIRQVAANAVLASEIARQCPSRPLPETLSRDRRRRGGFPSGVHGHFGCARSRAGSAVLCAGAPDVRRCGAGQPRHRQAMGQGQPDHAVCRRHRPFARVISPIPLLSPTTCRCRGCKRRWEPGTPAFDRCKPASICSVSATICSTRSRKWPISRIPSSRRVQDGTLAHSAIRKSIDRVRQRKALLI